MSNSGMSPAQLCRIQASRSSGASWSACSTKAITISSSPAGVSLSGGPMGIFGFQSFEQPLPGIAPAPLQRPQADIECLGGLVVGETQEVFNFNHLAPVAIHLLHLIEKHID